LLSRLFSTGTAALRFHQVTRNSSTASQISHRCSNNRVQSCNTTTDVITFTPISPNKRKYEVSTEYNGLDHFPSFKNAATHTIQNDSTFGTQFRNCIRYYTHQFLDMMKFSRDISRVKWLSGEKANVSKTISVLVLRVLVRLWLGKTLGPDLYLSQSVSFK